jgi:hypothetical protein
MVTLWVAFSEACFIFLSYYAVFKAWLDVGILRVQKWFDVHVLDLQIEL